MFKNLTLFFGLITVAIAFQSSSLGQEEKPPTMWSYSPPVAQSQEQDQTEQKELVDLLTQMLREMKPDEKDNAKAISRALNFIQRNRLADSAFRPLNVYDWQTGPDFQSKYGRVWEVTQYLADQAQPSPYWIGVQCEPTTEFALKLDGNNHITVKGGLTITTITDDSPAQAAGLQVGDIVFMFAGKQTNDLEQLVAGIRDSEGKASTVEIVRDEERKTIELTPRLRETETDSRESDKSHSENAYLALRDVLGTTTIPDDAEYTITLTKFGITDIRVKMADKKTATTADKLDALPESAQKFAKRLVDHTEELVNVHYLPNNATYLEYLAGSQPLARANRKLVGSTSGSIKRLEMQIQEILEVVKELQRKD